MIRNKLLFGMSALTIACLTVPPAFAQTAVTVRSGTITCTNCSGGYPADSRTTGTINSASSSSTFTVNLVNGEGVVAFAISGLTASGATLQFQGSNDGGTTWSPITEVTSSSLAAPSSTITADGQFRISATGRTNIKLVVNTTGTGSILVAANASTQNSNADTIAALAQVYQAQNQPGLVEGVTASGAAVTENPVLNGCLGKASAPTGIADSQKVATLCDLGGRTVVTPYSLPGNYQTAVLTTAMTATTATLLIPAPAAGLRNYVGSVSCGNSSSATGTFVDVMDGTSPGTVLAILTAGAGYNGESRSFNPPLRQPTSTNGIYVEDETTGASVKCSATYYTLPSGE